MHRLLYVSATRRNFPESELLRILDTARINNARLGVTGLLLYFDGGFLQVLEGDEAVIKTLYETIARDARHWDIKILLEEEAPRNFSAWSMGFKQLDDSNPEHAGLVSLSRRAIDGLVNPAGASEIVSVLVRTFCTVQGMPLR